MTKTDRPQTNRDVIAQAEIRLPSHDVRDDMPYFENVLGFRLDKVFPSDDPAVAVMSGHGMRIRLDRDATEAPGTIRIACTDPEKFADGQLEFTAPNGTKIEVYQFNPPVFHPETQHSFSVRRLKDEAPWVIGRAGMLYRDLVPDRLGGSIIASHIRIPDGGPVPDMVHYHTIGFQLIYCYRGWVRLVYEDQGPEFILNAGDCVIQPPEIRHRVLEASDNVEVIEIGVPADHETTIDHVMELPTPTLRPERVFGGQVFVRHELKDAVWQPWRIAGFDHRDTGISAATATVAGVQVARFTGTQTPNWTAHNSDILFAFVLEGSVTLAAEDGSSRALTAGDSFVVPPDFSTRFEDCSADLELLEVALPGQFQTHATDVLKD
ncbi:MAG: quercetin dioxygenase-like cupin family protein [Gammaproteobacteria bacterium]|jgi:quercetin dioxygenase-like cupin family protein